MKTKQKHLQNAGEEEGLDGGDGDGRAAAAAAVGGDEREESSDEFGGHVGTCWL